MRTVLARVGAAGGLLLALLFVLLLVFLPSAGSSREHSVFSNDEGGLLALYLLCEELEYPVRPWSAVPGELRGNGTLLVLSSRPPAPPELVVSTDVGDSAPPRSRDLSGYRSFIEEGGTLLFLGAADRELDFFRETLQLGGLDDLDSRLLSPSGDRRTVLAGDERVVLEENVRRYFRFEDPTEVLLHSPKGEALALARALAGGRIALSSLPFDDLLNASIRQDPGPALLFVRQLEALESSQGAPFERVLFDEYALGGWRPTSVARLALSPRLVWLCAHLMLFALVFGLRHAWSGPFPHDPEALLAASPLARARGFGRMLARAGPGDLLADLLRRGLLERWCARVGARSHGVHDQALELERLAGGDEDLRARLGQCFARAPADEGELCLLERELEELEHAIFPAGDARSARATGAGVPPRGS